MSASLGVPREGHGLGQCQRGEMGHLRMLRAPSALQGCGAVEGDAVAVLGPCGDFEARAGVAGWRCCFGGSKMMTNRFYSLHS